MPEKRFKSHLNLAKRGAKRALYAAIRKYGIQNFTFEILYQSKDRSHTLIEMEPHFISEYDSMRNGYNMNLGGQNVNTKEMIESAKKRMKENNPMTKIRTNRGTFKKGHVVIITDEQRKQMSSSKLGSNNPNYGNKLAANHLNLKSFVCERCGIFTNKGNYIRWHGNKCQK